MVGVDVLIRTRVAPGEDIFLDGVEAVETPVVLRDAAGDLMLESAARVQVVDDGLNEIEADGACSLITATCWVSLSRPA